MSGAEKSEPRERAEGNAGGVRVEREVRPSTEHWPPEHTARLDSSLLVRERETMPTAPKGKGLELLREPEGADDEVTSMMAEIHGPTVER